MISAAISGKKVAIERVTNVYQLGLMEYSTAYELQKTFHGRRLGGKEPEPCERPRKARLLKDGSDVGNRSESE